MPVCLQQHTISWRTFSGNASGESFLDWCVNILGVARGFHECLSEAAPGLNSSQWTWLSCDFPVGVGLYRKAEMRALIFPLVSEWLNIFSCRRWSPREVLLIGSQRQGWWCGLLRHSSCSPARSPSSEAVSLAVKHLIFVGFFSFFHSFFFLIGTQKFIEVKEISRENFPFHQLLWLLHHKI